jgi:hypothetical protein
MFITTAVQQETGEAVSAASTDPTTQRLEEQITWYDRKSVYNQRVFKTLKTIQIVSGALVPLFAGFGAPTPLTGSLGVIIVVLEGLQQLNQYQQCWVNYRSTCEALRHEKYLYLAHAGPYKNPTKRLAMLAERIEGMVSQEHAKWVSAQEEALADDDV